MKKTKVLILLTLLFIVPKLFAQKDYYSNQEIVSDLEYLKCELEEYHPNLYTYSSKEQLDNWFKNIISNLPRQIEVKEAFRIISSISSVLKDGHSYIYPSDKHLDFFYNSAPLFPLDVFLVDDKLVVVSNNSLEQNIPVGSTLTQINGIPTENIQSLIVEHISRDGNNLKYPRHLFYQFFPAYFSFFYGFHENYELEYIADEGERIKKTIKALKRDEIKTKRNNKSEKAIDLLLIPNERAAILSIKSFDKKILKKDYQQKFKTEIRNAFKTLSKKNVEYLAVDLRDNQGGELSNGVYLLKHFMNSPFQCVDSYYVIKKGEKKKLNSKWDNYFKPKKKYHFDHSVYLFQNGGSYSCSAIVANTFKENNRGKILGEMSGGSAYVNSGGPNHSAILPNTKITFTIPKTQYNLRKDLNEKIGQGVLPDIRIQDDPVRIINNKDNFIDQFITLIGE